MATLTMQVPDISCGHCKAAIEQAVGQIPGVVTVSVDVAATSVRVERADGVAVASIEAAIVEAGYTVGTIAGV
ncbi:heavy-metal-associated domain-containing protein [Frankia sp. AgKG'84/4]|uniref:heavy-metal-associated domain-containing protein n=1 Tax=Frankia sp. AgKG'84/4 TaxID=573490 RepID=UPI00200F4501|nr:cation transporter [Frankia sp. AgKG'84/4]MCL9796174.1 cation transporter [Frankia sp. AgKG'84/4]